MSHGISLGEAARVWARIAALSFGGPAGQIAVMHRILVEEKRWIGDARFLHALNYCMLLPGPEAQQLATYIGWLLHRTKGGLIAGGLFVLPGLLAIMALSFVYVLLGNVPAIEGLFFGLKAAVIAIVLQAVGRLGQRALRGPLPVAIACGAFAAIFLFDIPFPLIVLGAGLIGLAASKFAKPALHGNAHGGSGAQPIADKDTVLGEALPLHARPNRRWALKVSVILLLLWLGPVAGLWLALGPDHVFTQIALFFSQMAVVTFGGAYAVLAYVSQEAVGTFGWLAPGEMLDGLGMAETTPGPLIIVTQFVGFMGAFRDPGDLHPLTAAALGGLLTTWVTFLPCFLWIFLGAPYIERLRGSLALSAALAAITAAVVGVILNLALWFAIHSLFAKTVEHPVGPVQFDLPVWHSLDPVALVLTLAATIAVLRFKAGTFPVLAACAVAGMTMRLLGLV